MKRRALGKGLENIIKNKVPENKGGILEVELSNIFPNPFQPRKHFDKESIEGLAKSIKESGLIQPVVVYKEDSKYFLIVGERRWRAFQYLKRSKIPVFVKEYVRDQVVVDALVENIHREDLNAIEVAEGIDSLIDKTGFNQEQAARKIGMKRTTLANHLRLLNLPTEVKQAIVNKKISQGHARALLSLNTESEMVELYHQVVSGNLSVRQTENAVKEFRTKSPEEKKVIEVDPDIQNMEDRLAKVFSTRVHLKYSPKGNGKIEIFFNQLEEFERIFQILEKGVK
jgi:ParB family chromosome partitioning protein